MKSNERIYRIGFGSTSEHKLKFLQNVLTGLSIRADIIPINAPSGISEQPLSSKETIQGAINRSRYALIDTKEMDFGLGAEVGYELTPTGFEMLCWATITDHTHRPFSALSNTLLLPNYFQNILRQNLYLGDNLDGYLQSMPEPTKSMRELEIIIRFRQPFIETAIKRVLTMYLNDKGKTEYVRNRISFSI